MNAIGKDFIRKVYAAYVALAVVRVHQLGPPGIKGLQEELLAVVMIPHDSMMKAVHPGWPDAIQAEAHGPLGGAIDAATLAVMFHNSYERLAPSFGYKTREETRRFDPDSPNGKLMVATCQAILDELAE